MNKKIDYKWTVLLLVSVAYFLAQGTRQIYAAVLPQIKADLAGGGIDDTRLGLVSSTFTFVFGLMMPFAGLAGDLLKRKWVLVTGGILFSVGIFCSGFATGLGMLFISYGILNAIGQSLMPPCNSSLISQYHVETRGTAFSIYQSAIYLGIIVCSLVSGQMAGMGEGGWRKAFWLFGAISLVWSLVIALRLKDSPVAEQSAEASDEGVRSIAEAFKAFARKPTSFILMAALGCYFFTTYAFKTWSPVFMMRAFPEMPTTTAIFHVVVWFYVGALVGVTLGGRISDRRRKTRPAARLDIELVGLALCVPFVLLMAFAQNLPLMILAIAMFGFATGVYDSNLYAALFEVINPRYRAVATGLFGCGGCIFGAFGPAIAGLLSDSFGMRVAMGSLAAFALLGTLCILFAKLVTFKKDQL